MEVSIPLTIPFFWGGGGGILRLEIFIPLLFPKKNCGGILRLEVFIPLTIPFFGGGILRLEIFIPLLFPKKMGRYFKVRGFYSLIVPKKKLWR